MKCSTSIDLNVKPLNKLNLPDRPLYNFTAPKYVDQQILCTSKKLIDGFQGVKWEKGRSGDRIFYSFSTFKSIDRFLRHKYTEKFGQV